MRKAIIVLLSLVLVAIAATGCRQPLGEVLERIPLPPAGETREVVTERPPSPTPAPTATPTPVPTPTPAPAEVLSAAELAMHDGDYEAAAEAYGTLRSRALDDQTRSRVLLGLGRAHLLDQDHPAAVGPFRELLNEHPGTDEARDAMFLLGDALAGAGQPLSATVAYSAYLKTDTVITPYVNLSMGDALREAGRYAAALTPYEKAVVEAPNRSFEALGREKLAWTHIALAHYSAAVDQYDAILRVAREEPYRAQIEHQAAETLLLAGDTEAGYERHLRVVQTYPTEDHAYVSLVKLVEAGRPVDDLLRGQVDYHGEAYGKAVEALYRYIQAYPQTHSGDAHWYAGLSFIEADSIALAVNEFELLIDTHPSSPRWGDAWLRLAELRADQGQTVEAVRTYRAFVEAAPTHPQAPEALWEAGQVSERAGATDNAVASYLECQAAYPLSDFAAQALFRGGLQLYQLGNLDEADTAWTRLAESYPDSPFRPAALLWLGKLHLAREDPDAALTALSAAMAAAPEEYYGLRAAEIASDASSTPVPSPEAQGDTGGQEEAEAWLAAWVGLESPDGIRELAPHLAADGRLQRGTELWRLGRFHQAKTELEALRSASYSKPLDQYQLALAYRDIGLYRSSILCARRLVALSPVTRTLDAPRFVLQLAYPTYYENLVMENAQRTHLRPLLIFSLIRQESLFESLATSWASAHGLMQVIPPTGAEIASELEWPPDYSSSDLYLPFVSLRFGTYYLAEQRDRFDGRIDVALAAYNGGPFNAARWLERAGDDQDQFFEEITLSETRLYVKLIREHLAVYRAIYTEYD